ncbi:MAG: methionine--tRNA ligase [Nanoarchaeota archaeon]
MGKDRVLVTSALPYVNNIPHLGNMVCVLSADVYARFLRSRGIPVTSVLGTDEHGTTTEIRALQEGVTPRQLVDKYYKIHKEIYEWFNTDFDCFGRTSDEENVEVSQDIFTKLHDHGYVIKQTITQMWDPEAEKFLADRFIIGICPHCGFEEAKGDQCDNCGKLLSPEELNDPRSTLTSATPIPKESEHLFIDLQKLEPELMQWITKHEASWSANARTTTRAWLKEGLKPRCITRDLKWGIPVPVEGFEKKVFYSWFDAPIGYISITKGCKDDWQEWWKDPEGTRLVQFMGKDNIPFHTILFPAFCIGSHDGYTLMDTISVNEYLNYEAGKFSKSRGQGVFCDDAMATGIPADCWRYYIMTNRPEKEDTTFDWKDFQEKINKELLANFGNLVNRTLTFIERFFDGKIPEQHPSATALKIEDENVADLMGQIQLRKAIKAIMSLSRSANQYFQDNQPWVLVKEDMDKAGGVISNLAIAVRDLAIMIQPFMPEVSDRIFHQLALEPACWQEMGKPLPAGHQIGSPEPLFSKLEDEKVAGFKKEFNGKTEEQKMEKEGGKMKFEDLDLRVGRITSVEKHPDADKLYIEHVDLGDEQRQIVSGLVGHYAQDELEGKQIIMVTNLAPAKLRGVKSEGMLLAAGQEQAGLLLAPEASPGDRVTLDQSETSPQEQIDISQFFAVEITAKDGHAYHDGKPLMVGSHHVVVDKGIEGKVR